jgi:hypothetical protein
VTARTASCPGCGARIAFENAAALFVVCPHCGGASERTDLDLSLVGRVAQVAPIESVLSLGAEGRLEGERWRAVGLLQLDHGAGPWNEWFLSFEDGSWAWLAEAQGELLLTREAALERPPPAPAALRPGDEVVLPPHGRFVVAESRSARVVSSRGELPVRAVPGETYEYADLRAPRGGFATVAATGEPGGGVAYVGRTVARAELGIDPTTVAEAEPARVAARRLACPKCGDSVDVRDPFRSIRVVCPSCGTMTDPREGRLRVLGVAAALKARPALPIGSRGTLRGRRLEVLCFLVRSVRTDAVYRWREYLLRDEAGGYRWLVESDGHWNLASPLGPGDVALQGTRRARWDGRDFRFFQGGTARVDHVQGEAYWAVEVGEEVKTRDFVGPPSEPWMISVETSGEERVVSLAEYVPASEVSAAFGGVPLPASGGVAPNQPNPHRSAEHWRVFLGLAAASLVLFVFFQVHHDRRPVFSADRAAGTPGGEGAFFSDEFELEHGSANVEVALSTTASAAWIGLDGSLVDVSSGEVRAFGVDAERWAADDEGSGRGRTRFGPVPRGRYALRFEPSTAGTSPAVPYRVVARSQVPSTGRFGLLLALLAAVPLVSTGLRARFESRRWEASDVGESTAYGMVRSLGSGGEE